MRQRALIKRLQREGIDDQRVLTAISEVPRHLFVGKDLKKLAYEDEALPIGCGQTISQPFIVAVMTQTLLAGKKLNKVLEVGTGSGYQAAVLSHLADQVYTIERIKLLLTEAEQRFSQLNLKNIFTLHGDGYLGWPEHAPYDGIIVTAAATDVPTNLIEQLVDGGQMIIPLGEQFATQQLTLVTRHGDEASKKILDYVVFVPMLHGTTP